MSDQNRTVLFTGASAGSGKSFAEVFFKNGFNLVLTARRTDRLEAIKANLLQTSKNQEIHIISADLSNEVARGVPVRLGADAARVAALADGASGPARVREVLFARREKLSLVRLERGVEER